MAEIHIFSGLGSSIVPAFRKGTKALESAIDGLAETIDAQHHIWSKWENVAIEIKAKRKLGTLVGPVILIGHSNGVLACAKVASKLEVCGIEVAYVGAIDPTAAKLPAFGKQVLEFDEFWASSGYPKLKRWATNNKRAACLKVENWIGIHAIHRIQAGHVAIGSHATVHKQIIGRVKHILSQADGSDLPEAQSGDANTNSSYPDDNPKTVTGLSKPSTFAIPPAAKLELAEAMADGRRKYGLMNWREKRVSTSVYMDAIDRHLMAYQDGENHAPDSGVHHLGHVMACCAIILDAEACGKLNDDRSLPGPASRIIAEKTVAQNA